MLLQMPAVTWAGQGSPSVYCQMKLYWICSQPMFYHTVFFEQFACLWPYMKEVSQTYIIKNYLRWMLNEERMRNLAISSTQRKTASFMDFNDIIDKGCLLYTSRCV